MRRAQLTSLAGLILVAIGILFYVSQVIVRDLFVRVWSILGAGPVDLNANLEAFGVIIVGAILLIYGGVAGIKD